MVSIYKDTYSQIVLAANDYENCGIEFDNTFNNEWGVDEHYMNSISSQMRLIDDCIQKFVLLKDRMEYNVSVEY